LYEYYEFLEYQKSKERAFVKQQQEHRIDVVKRNQNPTIIDERNAQSFGIRN
jgi:hypothetical protein